MQPKYKRVLLKLSGEAMAGDAKSGLDFDTVLRICASIKECADMGVQIGVVVGGGNFWRGRSSGRMDRTRADHMGMLATTINALALADALEQLDCDVRVQTAIAMQPDSRALYPQPGGPPSGKGACGDFRLRHRQSLLLHRHRLRPCGRRRSRPM